MFLTLETSPGNYQAWLAMPGAEDKDFARRVRKGTGADATASGATRVAGSLNFKDKYAPTFRAWRSAQAQAGRLTSAAELDRLGLVAAPETVAQPLRMPPARSRPGPGSRRWPSYARCVDGAPLNSEETGPDISRADFVWCMTAITWGWSTEETAERLMEESTKAQANGRGYADLTARNAAQAVERRRQQPTRQTPDWVDDEDGRVPARRARGQVLGASARSQTRATGAAFVSALRVTPLHAVFPACRRIDLLRIDRYHGGTGSAGYGAQKGAPTASAIAARRLPCVPPTRTGCLAGRVNCQQAQTARRPPALRRGARGKHASMILCQHATM